jgi:hypothetical protein
MRGTHAARQASRELRAELTPACRVYHGGRGLRSDYRCRVAAGARVTSETKIMPKSRCFC